MNDVSLKEFIEVRLAEMEKRLDERQRIHDNALTLQAREYERRLEGLNHEHARLASDRERYTTREKFEDHLHTFDTWKAQVNTAIATASGKAAGLSLAWAVFLAVGGVLGGFVLTALGFWLSLK